MMDIGRKLSDLARKTTKKQTYLKCVSDGKRLGFKFDIQKESNVGSTLMAKAE